MGSVIKNYKDFYAALIYLAVGQGAIFLGRELPMGTALKMGPAYFPSVLGWLLSFIGVIALVRCFRLQGSPIQRIAWKPLAIIVVATLAFGYLVRGAGLIYALPLFIFMTAVASVKFRWVPTLAIAMGTTAFCAFVFVKGLGVPLPLIGRWLGG